MGTIRTTTIIKQQSASSYLRALQHPRPRQVVEAAEGEVAEEEAAVLHRLLEAAAEEVAALHPHPRVQDRVEPGLDPQGRAQAPLRPTQGKRGRDRAREQVHLIVIRAPPTLEPLQIQARPAVLREVQAEEAAAAAAVPAQIMVSMSATSTFLQRGNPTPILR